MKKGVKKIAQLVGLNKNIGKYSKDYVFRTDHSEKNDDWVEPTWVKGKIPNGVPRGIDDMYHIIKNPGAYKKIGAKVPNGFLLYGPPGTGKTLLARTLSEILGIPFLACSSTDFASRYFGGNKFVKEKFEQLRETIRENRQKKGILFIDEIDHIGARRDGDASRGTREQLIEILVQLDGFDKDDSVITIGATNRPETLDAALLRRLNQHIYIPLPSQGGRKKILQHYIEKVVCDVKNREPFLVTLVGETQGWNADQLSKFVNESAIRAVRRGSEKVTEDDFFAVLERYGNKKKSHDTTISHDTKISTFESICIAEEHKETTQELYQRALFYIDQSLFKQLIRLINDKGLDIAAPCKKNGDTLLHRVALNVIDADVLKELFACFFTKKQFDIDVVNQKQCTPLHAAIFTGNKAAVEILIKLGANPLNKDVAGNSCIDYALEYEKNSFKILLILRDGGYDYRKDPDWCDLEKRYSNKMEKLAILKEDDECNKSLKIMQGVEERSRQLHKKIIFEELCSEGCQDVQIIEADKNDLCVKTDARILFFKLEFIQNFPLEEIKAIVRHEIEHLKNGDSQAIFTLIQSQELRADMQASMKYPQAYYNAMIRAHELFLKQGIGKIFARGPHGSYEERIARAKEILAKSKQDQK